MKPLGCKAAHMSGIFFAELFILSSVKNTLVEYRVLIIHFMSIGCKSLLFLIKKKYNIPNINLDCERFL